MRARRRWQRRRGRRPRRLFWRVYGYGLVLLLAVTASMGLAARLVYDMPAWGSDERLASYVDAELTPLLDDGGRLELELLRLHDLLGVDLAVYSAAGDLLAAAGERPPAARRPPPDGPSLSRHGGDHEYAAPLDGGRAYAVARARIQGVTGHMPAMLLVVLLVLALVSAPLARSIVRPLERVTATARALGQGDLSARTGLCRVDEVGELAREVDEMAARLERLVASEKELLANVSHELRTPLARIRVALELAEEDATGSREHLEGIAADLAELDELIEQVLVAARLERMGGSGAPPLTLTELDVDELLAAVEQRFDKQHRSRPLQIVCPPDLPAVEADRRLIERVLANLLDNAAKYVPAEAGPIELSVDSEPAGLRFSVRDHGGAVPEADLARLFEPFFRAERRGEVTPGGFGLGLALCRGIVLTHGGRIEARAAHGGGLEVWFTLPRGEAGSAALDAVDGVAPPRG